MTRWYIYSPRGVYYISRGICKYAWTFLNASGNFFGHRWRPIELRCEYNIYREVFVTSPRYLYIPRHVYMFLRYLYILRRVYIFRAVFIYIARCLLYPLGIYIVPVVFIISSAVYVNTPGHFQMPQETLF